MNIGCATLLPGADGGRYPNGNSLLVRGAAETVLIDPSLMVAATPPAGVDRVVISHCHEDHMAGIFQYPDVPIHVHGDDLLGLQSLDGLMRIYGLPSSIDARWRHEVLTRFHYVPRPDANSYRDGEAFDLGGGATLRAVHLPGHTRGHSGFLVEPDGVMFLADIDLTGFGPYYGDAWSSVDDFERTLQRCRDIDARWYVTFHHKGIVEGRAAFLALLDEYESVIGRRERALLDYLGSARSLDDIVAHRFVYRPHVTLLFAEAVERRSAEQHLARLLAAGSITEVEPDTFVRTSL